MLPDDYRNEVARRIQAESTIKAQLLALQNDLAEPGIWPTTGGPDTSVFALRLKLLKARVAGGSLSLAAVEEELGRLLASLEQPIA